MEEILRPDRPVKHRRDSEAADPKKDRERPSERREPVEVDEDGRGVAGDLDDINANKHPSQKLA